MDNVEPVFDIRIPIEYVRAVATCVTRFQSEQCTEY
jgi:hypothetical protein